MTRKFSNNQKRSLRKPRRGEVIATGLAAIALLAPSGADAKRAVPSGNLTANPSFTAGTDGWAGLGSEIARVRDRRAPGGRHAAKVAVAPGADEYTIDDAPSTVSDVSAAGTAYKASGFVRGTAPNVGENVAIVVRESAADGSYVGESENTISLSRKRYKRVSVTHTTADADNVIDLHIRRPSGEVLEGEAMRVDAISLVETGVAPPEDPPVEEDPPEDPPVEEDPPEDPPVEEDPPVDATAPQTSIDSGPSGTINNASPSFSFSSDEPGSTFECRLDSGAWAACPSPKAYSNLAAGSHSFEVRAADQAANVDQTPASRNFVIDTTAPQTQIESGPTGTTNNASPSFSFSSSETSSSFECRLDSGAWSACSSPRAHSNLAAGSHTFEVRARDQVGNTDQTPAARNFVIDTTAPQTQIDSGPTGATNDASPSFAFSSSESGSSFECRLDSGSWAACSSPKAYSDLGTGDHGFEVRARDQVGNTDQSPASRSFSIETLPPEDPPSGQAPLTTSEIAILTSHEDPMLDQPGAKYRYIIIRDNLHSEVDEIRASHPEAEILVYKDVSFTVKDGACAYDPYQGGGVSHCDANSHENWYLHRQSNGSRITSSGYSELVAMNIANAGYQQAWLSSVRERLQDGDYDGVFMDDTNLFPGHGMDGQISELSDNAYRNATVDFVDTVSPALQAAGFKTMVNLAMNPWETAERSATLDVAEDVSAINREGFIRWGEGTTFTDESGPAPFWRWELELMEDIQDRGAGFHAITYGPANDIQAQRYMRATFLLGWNGEDGSSNAYRVTSTAPPYMPDWTTDIGTPTGNRQQVGQGWRRNFSDGTVVINAKASGSQTFNLGGSYKQPDGSCTSQVTLGATKALVLPEC